MPATVWMQKYSSGEPDPTVEPKEVDGSPEVLLPLMNQGWHQCDPPGEKKTADVKESSDA
jgi:hypothetical protein